MAKGKDKGKKKGKDKGKKKGKDKGKKKGKDIRITVILECTSCVGKSFDKKSTGISRYITQKNQHNTPNQLELLKFCRYCKKYTIHGEIKK